MNKTQVISVGLGALGVAGLIFWKRKKAKQEEPIPKKDYTIQQHGVFSRDPKTFADAHGEFRVFYNAVAGYDKRRLFQVLHETESSFPDLRKTKSIRVVEVGSATGSNLEFYPKNTKLTAIDPNKYVKEYFEENLTDYPGIQLEKYIIGPGEDMKEIPDHSVDAVVSTLVLCSVDIRKFFKEIQRVLVPGGKFLFLEHLGHGHGQGMMVNSLMKLTRSLGLFHVFFHGGAHDLDVEEEIQNGGFASLNMQHFILDAEDIIAEEHPFACLKGSYHTYGVATTFSFPQ